MLNFILTRLLICFGCGSCLFASASCHASSPLHLIFPLHILTPLSHILRQHPKTYSCGIFLCGICSCGIYSSGISVAALVDLGLTPPRPGKLSRLGDMASLAFGNSCLWGFSGFPRCRSRVQDPFTFHKSSSTLIFF